VSESVARGTPLAELLLAQPAVQAAVSAQALRAALDPANYTGLSGTLAREMAAAARVAAADLQAGRREPVIA
jgi:hypothetical protein